MSPFRCAGENGMRVESWATFRTETQRRTEAAGQARLAQRGIYKKYLDLIYILVQFNLFGCGRNREARAGCFTAVSTEKEQISFTPDHIYGMKARRNDKSRYFL